MRRLALLILLWPAVLLAQPGLVVEGETLTTVTKLPFKVVCPDKADDYVWRVPPAWKYTEGDGFITVTEAAAGAYSVGLRTLNIDFKAGKTTRKTYELAVNVGAVTPPGPGPGPGPGPNPPDPFGKSKAAGGLRVLMLFDSKAKSSYTSGQLNVLEGKAVRDYLEARCAPDPRVPAWKAYRIWPADTDASGEDAMWKKVFARPHSYLPWVVLGNGTTGYEGPLPADPDAAVALLRKYAEGK